jgi:hypothetical protein
MKKIQKQNKHCNFKLIMGLSKKSIYLKTIKRAGFDPYYGYYTAA